MSVFTKEFSLAFIKEVGEEDVLITIDNKDVVIKLSDDNRESIFQAIEEGIYIVPYNKETNELLMNVDDEVLQEVFPEMELEQMQNVTDDIPDEHK